MDFRKAFDKLHRRILIYKLLNNGISNKFVSIVKTLYSSVRLRVRSGGVLSDEFDNFLGEKLLFLFFINDIIQDISVETDKDIVSLNGILIYLILFADDTVLFGKSTNVLQHLLNKLLLYCNIWNIEEVNSGRSYCISKRMEACGKPFLLQRQRIKKLLCIPRCVAPL